MASTKIESGKFPHIEGVSNCPFCGSDRIVLLVRQERLAIVEPGEDSDVDLHWGECINCEARGPLVGSCDVAKKAWNDRAVDRARIQAMHEAIAMVYFADDSDYLPAFYSIVCLLGGDEAKDLLVANPKEAYHKYDPEKKVSDGHG
jgi:hypothetical protein